MKPLQIDTESPRWRIYKQGHRVSIAGPDTAVGFTVVPEARVDELERLYEAQTQNFTEENNRRAELEAALREIEERHGRQVAEAEAESGRTVPAECGCEDCLTIDAVLADVEGKS